MTGRKGKGFVVRVGEIVQTRYGPRVVQPRFPLPVSHSRAPRCVSLKTTVLIGAVCLATGWAAALYTIGLIVTRS